MTTVKLLHDLLAARVRSAGTGPLITHYAAGQRTELSGRTFANWVDKTAALITEELDLGEGDRVRLLVGDAHPGHWMTLVWVAAALKSGLEIVPAGAELIVTGPDPERSPTGEVVACSLHPLGLGFDHPLPPGVIDYSEAARQLGDVYLGPTASPDGAAWLIDGDELDQTQILDCPAISERVLVRPTTLWQTARAAVIGPLLGGGSSVVVSGEPTPDELAAIRASERVVG